MQKRHFVLYDVLPGVGTVAAIVVATRIAPTALDLILFGALWVITGVGITSGYHRLFTHRSYKAKPALRVALAIFGSAAAQGPVISWSAMHRRHHELADLPGDMHSPNLHGKTFRGRVRGFIHAHLTWMIKHEYPNVSHYTPDLLKDRLLVKTARMYRVWIVLGLAIPTAIGGLVTMSWVGALTAFLWGGMVRMFVVGNAMWALNSFLHTMGSKAFAIPKNPNDESRNNAILAVFSWGEGWHNNHHAFPHSAWFGLAWYRVDIGWWAIRLFEVLGLASDVKIPTREQIEAGTPVIRPSAIETQKA